MRIIENLPAYNNSIKGRADKRLVSMQEFIPDLIIDFKYASSVNFIKKVLYENPVAFVRLPVAVSLQKVQRELAEKGLGLKLFDAYRPFSVTEMMWKIVPDNRFTANPIRGSAHNKGTAVDVTLINLATKQELKMPTDFDDFTRKANHNYMKLVPEVIHNRTILKSVMKKYGFKALSTEWWHYSLPLSEKFELLNLSFSDLHTL